MWAASGSGMPLNVCAGATVLDRLSHAAHAWGGRAEGLTSWYAMAPEPEVGVDARKVSTMLAIAAVLMGGLCSEPAGHCVSALPGSHQPPLQPAAGGLGVHREEPMALAQGQMRSAMPSARHARVQARGQGVARAGRTGELQRVGLCAGRGAQAGKREDQGQRPHAAIPQTRARMAWPSESRCSACFGAHASRRWAAWAGSSVPTGITRGRAALGRQFRPVSFPPIFSSAT